MFTQWCSRWSPKKPSSDKCLCIKKINIVPDLACRPLPNFYALTTHSMATVSGTHTTQRTRLSPPRSPPPDSQFPTWSQKELWASVRPSSNTAQVTRIAHNRHNLPVERQGAVSAVSADIVARQLFDKERARLKRGETISLSLQLHTLPSLLESFRPSFDPTLHPQDPLPLVILLTIIRLCLSDPADAPTRPRPSAPRSEKNE